MARTSSWLMLTGLRQCTGIRNRLRCRSVLTKTYVEGSCPSEMNPWSISRAPGTPATGSLMLIPPGGRSGSDLATGVGIRSPFAAGAEPRAIAMYLPSEDHPAGQYAEQSFLASPPCTGTAIVSDDPFSLVASAPT